MIPMLIDNFLLLWLNEELMVKKQKSIGQTDGPQTPPNSKRFSRSENRKLLLELLQRPKNELHDDHRYLADRLRVRDITPILNRKGKYFPVKAGKRDRRVHKSNQCYTNAGRNLHKGYGYVEGLCINKTTGFTFSHAWNIDKEGNHLDFTIDDPETYDYLGIIIPDNIVYEVLGDQLGGVWTSVLFYYKKF